MELWLDTWCVDHNLDRIKLGPVAIACLAHIVHLGLVSNVSELADKAVDHQPVLMQSLTLLETLSSLQLSKTQTRCNSAAS